ncbi:MAG: sulfite dehydrogenase, partial [Betaproteobacteria bacterium]
HRRPARHPQPELPKPQTRYRIDWNWYGAPALQQTRAVDETGHVQPTINQLRAVRGSRSIYHNNKIHTWRLAANGEVSNVQLG